MRHKYASQHGFRRNRSRHCHPVLLVRNLLRVQRVEVADHLVQAGGVEMGVDLGGLDAGMAQQLLQDTQVGSAGMHVGGECIAQHVRRNPLRAAGPPQLQLL